MYIDDNLHNIIIPHSLNTTLANLTMHLPPHDKSALLCYVHVSVDEFIALAQEGPVERIRVCNHLFAFIDLVVRPNKIWEGFWQELNFLKITGRATLPV